MIFFEFVCQTKTELLQYGDSFPPRWLLEHVKRLLRRQWNYCELVGNWGKILTLRVLKFWSKVKILYKSKYVLPKIVNILKTTGEFGKKLSYQNTGMVSWVG